MVGFVSNISAKSALFALRAEDRPNTQRVEGIISGAFKSNGGGASAFFSISSKIKSEGSIFRAIGSSLGEARNAVAAARAGTEKLTGVIGEAEKLIGAVEAGAPGQAFKGSLDRLASVAGSAIAAAGFGGTNLLQEGETLTVTLGFNAGGSDFDFRQLNFEAVGLAATEAARTTTETVTRTVTETVETPVTRGERLNERLEKLTERQARLETREERIASRLEKLSEREARLQARIERLEGTQNRINERLEAAGARPTDPRDARMLDQARRFADFADTLEARGSRVIAGFVDAVADRLAERAGLTISLDKLDRLEGRIEKLGTRIEKTNDRLERVAERETFLNERRQQVNERQEAVASRIERITERLATLSEEQLNQVVATRTETVERTVTEVVTTEGPNEKTGSFTDIISAIGDRLKAGDTDGARAIVAEARARIAEVNGQLDRITGAVTQQRGFIGELTERLDSTIRERISVPDDENAARAAAGILSDLTRVERLFSGEKAPQGIVELFRNGKAATDTEAKPADKPAEDEKAD